MSLAYSEIRLEKDHDIEIVIDKMISSLPIVVYQELVSDESIMGKILHIEKGTSLLVDTYNWIQFEIDQLQQSFSDVGLDATEQDYGTVLGRIFAAIWLLVSTLAVARAFLYLAEARMEKRHRTMAKWILGQDMTVSEFLAADIDNNGYGSKSEFVIYKLTEMGKMTEKDIMQISQKFDRLDAGSCGKITLGDLMESYNR